MLDGWSLWVLKNDDGRTWRGEDFELGALMFSE